MYLIKPELTNFSTLNQAYQYYSYVYWTVHHLTS